MSSVFSWFSSFSNYHTITAHAEYIVMILVERYTSYQQSDVLKEEQGSSLLSLNLFAGHAQEIMTVIYGVTVKKTQPKINVNCPFNHNENCGVHFTTIN